MARGSKKGEKRGAAKGGVNGNFKTNVTLGKRGRGRPKGSRSSRTQNEIAYVQQVIEAAKADPEANITPRDVLLKIMRIQFRMMNQIGQQVNELIEKSAAMPASDKNVNLMVQVGPLMRQFEQYMLMASETAYKVAPYIHARLAAIAYTGGDNDAETVMSSLLDAVDKAERERKLKMLQELEGSVMTIDHDPAPARH